MKNLMLNNLKFHYIFNVQNIDENLTCIECNQFNRTVLFINSLKEKFTDSLIVNPVVSCV
jgi:hypothetical protein